MTKLFVDAAMQAKLDKLNGVLEICDEAGQTLGYFHPVSKDSGGGNKIQSPFTEEELERRRQQRNGRSLREILEGLKQA